MSKQDLIERTIERDGRFESLMTHLSVNFYPPVPEFVKKIFGDAFNMYWAGMIDVAGLEKELSRVYTGGIGQYDFWLYLDEEDLCEEDLGDEY